MLAATPSEHLASVSQAVMARVLCIYQPKEARPGAKAAKARLYGTDFKHSSTFFKHVCRKVMCTTVYD